MDDSKWMYDSYQDCSDLSGVLAKDGTSDDEELNDAASTAGSGSTATLVDNKENRTPMAGTPASRLSSNTQSNYKKDKVINIAALIDKNKLLEKTVFELKTKIGSINRELPWIMVDGKDHLAQYIIFKNENEELRKKIGQYEKDIDTLRGDSDDRLRQEMDRMDQEHLDQVSDLQARYERALQEIETLRAGPLPSPQFDQSINSEVSSMYSERSRQVGMMEFRVEMLEKDLKYAKIDLEAARSAQKTAENEVERLKREMEEKEREWTKRYSMASLQETFTIGIESTSRPDLMAKVTSQLERIDELEKQLNEKKETETKLAEMVKALWKQRSDLENELRVAKEASISMFENNEVNAIMKELLELSEMNERLQEECLRRGAEGMERKKGREEGKDTVEMEEKRDEMNCTKDIVEEYQKMASRLKPITARMVAINKSVLEHRSYLDGLKGFDVTGLSPMRAGEGSYSRSRNASPLSGTPGTPAGRGGGGGQSRLLQSVLQKSVMNVSAAEILNCSMNTSQGIRNAKEKLHSMKDSCRRLFDKLKGSYALFDEIRLALGGEDNSELARKMADLRLDLEMSVMESDDAAKAMEVVENSLFELQSILEMSMGTGGGAGRDSDFNLSAALGKADNEKEEEQLRRKDVTYSIDIQASAERQDMEDVRDKLETLMEEYRVMSEEFEELRKSYEEEQSARASLEEKYEEVQREREELYAEVESRRQTEERMVEEREDMVRRTIEEVNEAKEHLKAENEEVVARMQDEIDRLEDEVHEVARLREVESELVKGREELEKMRGSIQEKESDLTSLRLNLARVEGELEGMREEEKKNEGMMARWRKESEVNKEMSSRMAEEYQKLVGEMEEMKEKEEELEKKLMKYKFKNLEEAEANRRQNMSDESSMQTVLTMDKLGRMEWNREQMREGLSRLGRAVEETFLKKGEYGDDPMREIDETDVPRLLSVVERERERQEEQRGRMEEYNERLERYVESEERREAEGDCAQQNSDRNEEGKDSYTLVSGVRVKYSDPLRQLFYALTHVANNVVQAYKKASPKLCSGTMTQAEFDRVLEMLRDLRCQLNERYSQSGQKSSESEQNAGDAKMALRLAVVMEANDKLNRRIEQLKIALKSNWNAEDKARLLEKVMTEMTDISKTLASTVGVKGAARLPSSSSVATASTRRI